MFNMCFITVPAVVLVSAAGLYFLKVYLKRNKLRDMYFRSVIKSLPVGLYLRDTKGKFLFSNEEFSRMMGIPRHRLEKLTLRDVFAPEYLTNLEPEEKEISKTKNPLTIEKTMTFFGNKVHNYRILKSPVLDNKENIIAYVILFKIHI